MSRDGTVKHVLVRGSREFFLRHFDLFYAFCYLDQHSWNSTRVSIANTEVLYIMKHLDTNTVESKIFCDRVLFSSYKTCKDSGHSRCWARYTTEVRRCHKIRQVVNWRANKQQDLETIESRCDALFIMSVSRAKTAVNWCLVRCNSRFPLLNINVCLFMC